MLGNQPLRSLLQRGKPLFRGLRYGEAAFAYLLCGALTDQKILLHANDPALLLPAAQALRSLVAPLTFSSTYVPYLPTTLLHPSDAVTLINDSTDTSSHISSYGPKHGSNDCNKEATNQCLYTKKHHARTDDH